MEGEYFIDTNGVSWDSYSKYVALELCGLCGCGDDRIKQDVISVILDKDKARKTVNEDRYFELILHILDNAEIMEHGTSIYGSWLTEKGKEIKNKLKHE